jgi:O-antigen ligase
MYIRSALQTSPSDPRAAVGEALDWIAYVILCAFVATIPWGESLEIVDGIFLAPWVGLLAFGVAFLRWVVIRRARKPSLLHYSMLALIGWTALSALWTVDWDSTASRIGTFAQLLAFVWLIWELAGTERRVRGLLLAYVFGCLIASGITLYNYATGYTAAQLAGGGVIVGGIAVGKWDTSRYSVYGLNENDLGLMLALSIPIIFYLLASSKSTKVKVICWLQFVVGITAILLTASRGALLSVVVGLMMYPLVFLRLTRWQRGLSLTACAVLLLCAALVVPPSSWARIVEVRSELSGGTLSHRTTIWAAGMETFRDHALVGVGAGAYGASILKTVDLPFVAHNTFLSVLVELGVIGMLLLLVMLASMFYSAVRMEYLERCLWITLLLAWAAGVSALTWDYRKPTWLLFGLLAVHAYCRRAERVAVNPVRVDPDERQHIHAAISSLNPQESA